ncbi:MAG: hypothetical protein K2M76_00805 [Muribaculaceae bacterium]|nr:hypothetical protein [Muribaculaceae bacterium]
MANNRGSRQAAGRNTRATGGGGKGAGKAPLIISVVAAVAVIVALVWWFNRPTESWFDSANMEAFVAGQHDQAEAMPDGAAMYVDFSDGMHSAYADASIKGNLQSIVNKMTRQQGGTDFYSMASNEVKPLEMSDDPTKIFNYIMDPKSYNNTAAPIEKTLAQIVEQGKPAFIVSDFEEYKNGRIQQENYARDYFVRWIKAGNDITFYVMGYKEKGKKDKHLYFVVMDGKEHKLLNEINNALAGKTVNYEMFTLSNNNFPVYMENPKDKHGATYHNGQQDVVTMVRENGDKGSYRRIDGYNVEFYPSDAESWVQIMTNAKSLSELPEENNPFRHVLQGRYVDLTCNSGYDIDELEAVVYNATGAYRAAMDSIYAGSADLTEVRDFVVMADDENNDAARRELLVDFAPVFDGTFVSPNADDDLYRIDVCVKKASPKLDAIERLFAWDGNTSLSESVRNTLQESDVNPAGKVIYTYYFKLNK